MLKLKNVICRQGPFELKADLEIGSQITAVLGPSGAGKSTFLNLIAGFVPAASGTIFWQDSDVTNLPPGERPVSMIFQDNNLFPHLSVAANLALAFNGQVRPSNPEEEISEALRCVELLRFENRMPASLSGGQQARVALARVILQRRPLVLLDEAFASLGPALKRGMLKLVKEVAEEKNLQIIMVSHAPEDARLIAQSGIVVTKGCVETPIAIDALFADPPIALKSYL